MGMQTCKGRRREPALPRQESNPRAAAHRRRRWRRRAVRRGIPFPIPSSRSRAWAWLWDPSSASSNWPFFCDELVAGDRRGVGGGGGAGRRQPRAVQARARAAQAVPVLPRPAHHLRVRPTPRLRAREVFDGIREPVFFFWGWHWFVCCGSSVGTSPCTSRYSTRGTARGWWRGTCWRCRSAGSPPSACWRPSGLRPACLQEVMFFSISKEVVTLWKVLVAITVQLQFLQTIRVSVWYCGCLFVLINWLLFLEPAAMLPGPAIPILSQVFCFCWFEL